MLQLPSIVVPGDRVCSSVDAEPGPGTYLGPENDVYASVAGRVALQPAASPSGRAAVSVTGRRAHQGLVPRVGDVVICRVTNVSQRMAKMEIQCLGTRALDGGFLGVLRQEHVRATEIDKVEMAKSFRPGDVARCKVISLGDSRSFYLSTAANDLGVVYAHCATSGQPMDPVNWQEMQCPVTGAVEKRKVAKVSVVEEGAVAAAAAAAAAKGSAGAA